MKKSEFLRRALAFLNEDPTVPYRSGVRTNHICVALSFVANRLEADPIAEGTYLQVRDDIRQGLYPWVSVVTWLIEQGHITQEALNLDALVPCMPLRKQIQDYRRAWVLKLIEDYEKNGN